MFRFDKRSRDLDLRGLDLRLVDFLGLTERERDEITTEFDAVFGGGFLNKDFPGEKLCRTIKHLNPLLDAYVADRTASIEAGGTLEAFPPVEEWSRENGAQYAKDYVSLPHEGVRWFELRSIRTGRRVGALQISKINLVKLAGRRAHLCGHAIMTLPVHPRLSFAEYWGEVLKALLEASFIGFEDSTETATFEEWVLPRDPEARYIARGENTFGADVIRRASVDTIVERGDALLQRAPLNIRKRMRDVAPTPRTLRIMRKVVVRPAPKRVR